PVRIRRPPQPVGAVGAHHYTSCHHLSSTSYPISSISCSPPLRPPPSFPTRRSSDLSRPGGDPRGDPRRPARAHRAHQRRAEAARSEEHTSELQSRVDLVCRLLLEKKKQADELKGERRNQEGEV